MGKITIVAGKLFLIYLAFTTTVYAQATPDQLQVSETDLNFQVPTLGELLSAAIKFFFVVAGLAALFMLLWGAISWITSGGDSDAVAAARGKILNALIGVVLIIAVLAVIWTVEQVIFNGRVCLGLSCPVTLPNLLKAP